MKVHHLTLLERTPKIPRRHLMLCHHRPVIHMVTANERRKVPLHSQAALFTRENGITAKEMAEAPRSGQMVPAMWASGSTGSQTGKESCGTPTAMYTKAIG